MLHIPPTNLLLAAKQEPYKKAYLLTKNIEEFSGKSSEGPAGRKRKDRKGNRTTQNKRADSKVESNDSPEIPDIGETSDIPGLPSGLLRPQQNTQCACTKYCKTEQGHTHLEHFLKLIV